MTGAIYQALPVSLAVYVLWVISWDPHKMCFPQTHSSAENTGVHRGVMGQTEARLGFELLAWGQAQAEISRFDKLGG